MLPYLSQPLCKTWRVVVHRITQPRFRMLCSGATYRVLTLSFSALAANIVARASRIWTQASSVMCGTNNPNMHNQLRTMARAQLQFNSPCEDSPSAEATPCANSVHNTA